VLVGREQLAVSVSMVWESDHIGRTQQLLEALRCGVSALKRRYKRAYAVRKPNEYQATQPGDTVQADTPDVRTLPNVIRKQFSAIEVVSRYAVLDVHRQATSRLAASFLDTMTASSPFPIRGIRIDNRSVFMVEFEKAC
jgi:putative transposase